MQDLPDHRVLEAPEDHLESLVVQDSPDHLELLEIGVYLEPPEPWAAQDPQGNVEETERGDLPDLLEILAALEGLDPEDQLVRVVTVKYPVTLRGAQLVFNISLCCCRS